MENDFQKVVLVKSLLFVLIVFWGGYNSTAVSTSGGTEYFTDVGNILFLVFSIVYMFNAFLLIKLKNMGRLTYLPLILLFVFLGFISELFNPMQIKQDYFYIFTFYCCKSISCINWTQKGVGCNNFSYITDLRSI